MRQAQAWLIGAMAAILAAVPALAQQPAPAAPAGAVDVASLKAEREALESKLLELDKQVREIRAQLAKKADLVELHKAVEAATAARDAKYATEELSAARKAREDARAAADKVMAALIAADPEGSALLAQMETARKAGNDAGTQQTEAADALREFRRKMVKDGALGKEAEQAAKAELAWRNLPKTDPALLAAKRAIDDAQQALDEKIKTLPEKQVLDAARNAYEQVLASSAAVKSAREARDAAVKALDEAATARVKAAPEGTALLAKIEQLTQQEQAARDARYAVQKKLTEIRKRLRDNPAAADAQKQVEAADEAYQRIKDANLKAEEAALAAARNAYEDALSARLAAIPQAAEAQSQIKQISAQIKELAARTKRAQ